MPVKQTLTKIAWIRELYLLRNVRKGRMGKFMRAGFPIKNGKPYPWLTLPAVDYLDSMDLKGKRVLEFGSGYSTLFFDSKGAVCHSYEREDEWIKVIKPKLSRKSKIYKFTDAEDIEPPLHEYDILLIDVYPRPKFFEKFFKLIGEDGFCIFDNSDWYPSFFTGIRKLNDVFIVDFHGYSPASVFEQTTTFVYNRKAVHEFLGGRYISDDRKPQVSEQDRVFSGWVTN